MRRNHKSTFPAGCTLVLTPAMFVITLLALLFAAPAIAETVYHQPTPFPAGVTAGTHVWDCWTTNVYYGTKCVQDATLQLGGYGDRYVTNIRFDTQGLPKQVTGVWMEFTAYPKLDNSTPTPAILYQILAPWDPSTLTWINQPPAGYIGSAAAPVPGQKWTIDITTLWQNGAAINGVRIDPLYTWNNFSLFRSSRYAVDSDRPLLKLEFTPPVPTPRFKLPVPSGHSPLVSMEVGGYACTGGSIDKAHSPEKGKTFAIDFTEGGEVPILAAAAGRVVWAGWDPNDYNGYYVHLDHDDDGDVGTGFQTLYVHLAGKPLVSQGDHVDQGQMLGYMGSTGFDPLTPNHDPTSTGQHLHFAMRYRDSGAADELSYVTMEGLLLKSYMSECDASGALVRRYPSTNQVANAPVNRPPTLVKTASTGTSVTTGQAYSLTFTAADADGNLANVDVNWNDGTAVERKTVSGSSASVTFTRTFNTARTITWSATGYDAASAASTMLTGSFTVTAPANRAPTLVKTASTGNSVTTGQAYSLTFTAADADGNLANVDVNWNDGTAVERKTVSGSSASVTFTRTFNTARTITWSATGYDAASAASTMLTGSFTVTAPANRAPTLVKTASTGTGVATGQAYSLTFSAADADGNLANVDVNWNDGTAVERKTVSGSSASVTFTRTFNTARTITWSATGYDAASAASTMLTGSLTVTAPANRAPTLVKTASTGTGVATGQAYSLTFSAADADGNLANVDVNWNDGTAVERKTVSGSSASVAFTRTFSTARTISWSSTAYDTAGAASTMLTGSLTVTAPANRAPTLVKTASTGTGVATGQAYSLTFSAADADGNLANVDVNWNDGTAVERKTVSGSSASVAFTRTFSTARTISWSSTAYDTAGAASTMLTGSFAVTAPNRAPTLVKNTAPGASVAVGQTVSITVTATDPNGNLSNVDLNWNDGSAVVHRTISGGSATATFTKTFTTARTVNWSSTAYDTAGAASNMVTGSFGVR